MPISKCPRCAASVFETAEIKAAGLDAHERVTVLQCAQCGSIIGVLASPFGAEAEAGLDPPGEPAPAVKPKRKT